MTAWRPEPHTLFTVTAPTLTGRPALITAWRAGRLAHARGQHVAHERALDLAGLDARALHRLAHGDRAELGGRETARARLGTHRSGCGRRWKSLRPS